jgi:hypothetical protein
MCWSGEASTVLAGIGFATSGYAIYKKEPSALWVPLSYFSLMEALQAYTYLVIDDCNNVANQVATVLGYIHIAFQPFFGNMVGLYFIPESLRKKIEIPVYIVCFISAVVMISQLYPYQGLERCVPEGPISLCGNTLCSFTGNWHIAWSVPFSTLYDVYSYPIGGVLYTIAMFILPFLYGSWRWNVYHIIMGPIVSILSTSNENERAAVWCLISIGLLLIVIKTPFRNFLYVKKKKSV